MGVSLSCLLASVESTTDWRRGLSGILQRVMTYFELGDRERSLETPFRVRIGGADKDRNEHGDSS